MPPVWNRKSEPLIKLPMNIKKEWAGENLCLSDSLSMKGHSSKQFVPRMTRLILHVCLLHTHSPNPWAPWAQGSKLHKVQKSQREQLFYFWSITMGDSVPAKFLPFTLLFRHTGLVLIPFPKTQPLLCCLCQELIPVSSALCWALSEMQYWYLFCRRKKMQQLYRSLSYTVEFI